MVEFDQFRTAERKKMTKIAINGTNLHEIRMRLKGEHKGSICYLSYPEHRIKVKAIKNEILLQVPPLLAIAVYHLFFRNEKSILLKIKNKELGSFQIKEIQYPDELCDDGLVDIMLERNGRK